MYKSVRDELTRFAVFVRNFLIIEEHNARFAAGKTSFEMGISQFTDMVDLLHTLELYYTLYSIFNFLATFLVDGDI